MCPSKRGLSAVLISSIETDFRSRARIAAIALVTSISEGTIRSSNILEQYVPYPALDGPFRLQFFSLALRIDVSHEPTVTTVDAFPIDLLFL
jgi:hypothetical protein